MARKDSDPTPSGQQDHPVSDGTFTHAAEAAATWVFTTHTETHQAETKDTFLPKQHQNNKKPLARTNLKSWVSSTTNSVPLIFRPPYPPAPGPMRPRGPLLPGMMATVSFSQDTTLTYSCTEEGMRHLKTATLPRIDL